MKHTTLSSVVLLALVIGMFAMPEASRADAVVFEDDFANGVVTNSKSVVGFWTEAMSAGDANALVEAGGELTLTAGDNDGSNADDNSEAHIYSALSSQFNFFKQRLILRVRGVTFDDHGSGIGDFKQKFRFALLADNTT